MDTKKLRQKILDLAIHGKLVPQDPNDEPASVLLERIRKEKERLVKEGKIKKSKSSASSDKPPYENVPFEVPEGWEWTTIGEICSKIGSGSTPRGSNYSQNGISFFRSHNIYNHGLVYDDIKYISNEIHKSMISTEVNANDLLLNITGGSLGRCAIVPNDFAKGNVSQHVCIIRPIIVLPKYLHSFIISDYFSSTMILSGSGREGLPKYSLEAMMFPLPSLNEQNRIVKTIELFVNLIDSIELNETDLSSAITTAKSKILDLAIHGKLVPQNPNDEPASAMLKRLGITSDNRPYENVPFEIPGSWSWCSLGNISNYGKCKTIDIDDIPSSTWILELEDIEKDTAKVIRKFTKNERQIKGVRHVFQKTDVLYSKLRTYLNKVLVAPSDGCCTTEIIPIKCFEGINSDFLCIVLRSPYFLAYTEQCCYGVKMPRLSTIDARKGLIPLPPLDEQIRIVSKVNELILQLENIEQSLQE